MPSLRATPRRHAGRAASLLKRLAAHRKDLGLLARAAAWLFWAWLVIDRLPGRRYRKWLRPDPGRPHQDGVGDSMLILRVAWAVATASRHVPWRSACLHRGLAAQRMLSRAGIATELHFGVAKAGVQGLEAHAWLTAQGRLVLGGEARERFTALGHGAPSGMACSAGPPGGLLAEPEARPQEEMEPEQAVRDGEPAAERRAEHQGAQTLPHRHPPFAGHDVADPGQEFPAQPRP